MTNINAKLEVLFEFEKKLNLLIVEEEYESFRQQQDLFGDLLKDFLTKHSENELLSVIEPLKTLKKKVSTLQEKADNSVKILKDKSLALQRNKKKIKAYK